ncbi:sperm flagellar protein 2 [Pygocentrus nattereri]|uniref:sperm flagellar protein 2 n=1 Tax=Pygocentrus nattereri TaxID=42514 RepID=UPI001890E2A6|nr:sperm flagellar protein 2 [Pygocentrus nattereri]
MSDILCRWLNSELRLSKVVEPHSLSKDFSNGYLLGEVLSRFQLQEDFQSFSTNSSANAKLNNFTRLEPTLQLLGIPFDLSMAKAVMQGQPGAATRLLYQLYILLQKKKRSGLTGTALETMQPAATARLHRIENHIYTQRLRAVVKREADEKMQKITQRFDKRGQEMYGRSVMAELVHEEKRRHLQEERRLQDIEKHRQARKKQQEIMERIETAAVRLPKPPMSRSLRAPRKQQRQQEAQNVHQQIAQFEKSRKRLSPASYGPTSFSVQVTRAVSEDEMAQWNNEYVQKIRQRLEEDATAREQREKRRRRALIQQLHTHHTHEEMVREEQLIARLVRQSQQEKRIAVQLMQIRQQKEVLRQNRILRQRQYEEQRLTDFHQALDREAALLQQDRVEHQEEIRKERELHAHLAAERTQSKHQKHFNICSEILKQIVDLATKSGEYRLLTATAIPLKMMREWKELYFIGKPLYKVSELELGAEPAEPSPEQAIELEKLNILNQQDYDEYTNMMGEWTWPEEGESRAPPTNNDILGHVVARLQNIVNPPCLNDPSPQFPNFSLRACVLGKVCSGKSTCLTRISEAHGIHILSADTLIQEALAAHQAGEQVPNDHSPELETSAESCGSDPQEAEQGEEESSTAADSGLVSKDLPKKESKTKPTLRAQHGAVVEKALRRGGAIPDELLIDIFIHAVRQVPEGRGWVLDGFPANVSQARLLEKALSGADPDQADRKRRIKKPNLVEDRNAPKAPPPPLPALHLAMLLEVSDEQVLDRAIHRSQQVREENANKSDDALPKTQEQTLPPEQTQSAPPAGDHTHIQHRIAAFQDTWSKLEKWFGEKQKILVKVSAEVNEDALFRSVETVLFNTMTAAQKGDEAAESSVKVTDDSVSLTVPQPTASESGVRSHSPKEGAAGHSRRTSISTVSAGEAPSPTPGSTGWVYVDEPLPQEIAEYLVPYWDSVCSSYVSNVKAVMQNLRSERNLIIHHLYNIREDFKQYLQRPDLKQEFVSVWQRDYNSIPDDMRQDEETKAELHHRLDELRERLWDICDKRREEAMEERARVIGDGWLEDHTALLINHYSTLMQVEVDRFQDTLRVLRDYYTGMYRRVLPEAPQDFTCIPLLDITNNNGSQTDRTKSPSGSGPSERLTKSAGKKNTEPEVKKTKVVPLIERRSPSTDPPRLLQDIHQTALTAITNMASVEVQQVEMEVNQEVQQQQMEREKALSQASATHSAKKKSAKKKGPSSPTQEPTPPPLIEESLEEVQGRAVRSRIRQEYSRALQHEEGAARQRLELVKLHALSVVHSVQHRAEQTHTDMQEWLDQRFTSEMDSIQQLSGVVQHHIENSLKIPHQLVLDCTDFFIDGETRVLPTTPTPPRPPPLERTNHRTLSILQLHGLRAQLHKIAPTGQVSSTELCKVLQELTSLTMGSDALPEAWMNLTDSQVQELVCVLSQDREVVDWRQFLLSAAQPWPLPSQNQLLRTLTRFREEDTAASGVLTLEQYRQVELWFSSQADVPVPEDPTEPLPYDRLANLKEFFFALFADAASSTAVLDYLTMLLYFCCHPDPGQGFTRALSIVTQHKHQYRHPSPLLQSLPYMDGAEECEAEEEDESVHKDDGVTVEEIFRVLSHGGKRVTSHHRIESNSREELQQDLVKVFKELGFDAGEKIPFSMLSQHPFLQDLMEGSSQYLLADIHRVLHVPKSDGEPSTFT